jgi:hypothetical protein
LKELFVQDLARMSMQKSADGKNVDYSDLADIVDEQETLQFLQGEWALSFQQESVPIF